LLFVSTVILLWTTTEFNVEVNSTFNQ
jgi:hypothetical protein